jgi:uncharacterized protein YehS (DUF1456 family)
MINNDILRRTCTLFNLDNDNIVKLFLLGQHEITHDELATFFKEKNDPQYCQLKDNQLASFLNGLIVKQRGPTDKPLRQPEQLLSNNIIFNKLKIALALKAEEVIDILSSADVNLNKYELSSFFRHIENKHYKTCPDYVLSGFLNGLKYKISQ